MSNALTVITGTLPEKVQAFQQMAAAVAQSGMLGAWDTVPKVMAGCWAADAAGMHPMTFMQNVWPLESKGKVTLDPKKEFVIGVLASRLPGFKWEVLEETDDRATVRMSSGDSSHTVTYTWADAVRQGHTTGRNSETWAKNKREMLLKTAVKRCGWRIGAAAMMNMPMGDDVDTPDLLPDADATPVAPTSPPPVPGRAASTAEVVEDEKPVHAPVEDAAKPTDWRKECGTIIGELWHLGPKQVKDRLGVASTVMSQIIGAKTVFRTASELGPTEAQQIYEHLDKKFPRDADGKRPSAGTIASETVAQATGAIAEMSDESIRVEDEIRREAGFDQPDDDDAPPPATGVEEFAEPAPVAAQVSSFEGLMLVVKVAEKVLQTTIVKEAPTGSKKLWFCLEPVFKKLGYQTSVKLRDNGMDQISPGQYGAFAKLLTEEYSGMDAAGNPLKGRA